MAVGAIDAILDLLRGQVTREIRQAATRCADQQSMKRPVGSGWLGSFCQS